MPIPVICPGCKTQFRVSDQFAGKSGPCPKCKATINIPKSESVTIHAPEEHASAGKDSRGRPVSKPIPRFETRMSTGMWVGIVGAGLVAVVLAWFAGNLVEQKGILAAVGLGIVSLPLVLAGYQFLYDEEAEPHRGSGLLVRAAICAAIYALLWGVFAFVPAYWYQEYWSWFYIAPPFLIAGTVTAFACLDLEFDSGFFHYCFYLSATLLLAWVSGMPMFSPATG